LGRLRGDVAQVAVAAAGRVMGKPLDLRREMAAIEEYVNTHSSGPGATGPGIGGGGDGGGPSPSAPAAPGQDRTPAQGNGESSSGEVR
jgi:hypothetical protein